VRRWGDGGVWRLGGCEEERGGIAVGGGWQGVGAYTFARMGAMATCFRSWLDEGFGGTTTLLLEFKGTIGYGYTRAAPSPG